MYIPKMKKTDRAVLQAVSLLSLIDIAVKTNKKWPIVGMFLVPFIGSSVEAYKDGNGFKINIDQTYDDSHENVKL